MAERYSRTKFLSEERRYCTFFGYVPVAQLVEQWPFKPLAAGSNPAGHTQQKPPS